MTRSQSRERLYSVRSSPIHGKGVFALRPIPKGTRIVEYRGARFSPDEAAEVYARTMEYPFTYQFAVDADTVIDASINGNSARFINHSCAPNCESVEEDGRIFIEAIRPITPGEELLYDYRLRLDGRATKQLKDTFRCSCGAPSCRRTMLLVKKAKKKKAKQPKKSKHSKKSKGKRGGHVD
jgi:SET domain-containing protein